MSIELSKIKSKYNLETISARKSQLETQMGTAHSTPGANIGQISADLTFTTTLHSLVSQLDKKVGDLEQAYEIIKDGSDPEMTELAQADIPQLEEDIQTLDSEITKLQIEQKYSDPDDSKSAILEIRAGAGGDEAALFAADLFRMYKNYAASKGWNVEIMDANTTDNGGYKEVVAQIDGKNVFKALKFESGVHRVQRIPVTESGGRIHTSTASVAILPEAEDVEVDIKAEDLRIDTMRASGAGGQKVNKTDSAIRITHIPTGIVVSCQETKVQAQNKDKAMMMLRTKLYDLKRSEAAAARSDMRSSQIGTADRSEKIRTYNFPQSRITDHRVKISWHNIEEIMAGVLVEMVEEIRQAILEGMVVKDLKEG